MHAHRATKTKRHLQDRIDATRASRASSLATMDTCIACSPGWERPHTQMTCSRCSPGRVAPYSSTAYCSPCKGGTYAANATSCAFCPEGYYCSELHLCLKYAKTYRRTALLAPPRRKSPKQARTQIRSAQRRARAKAFTARADVASKVPIGILLPCWVSNHIVIRAGMYTNANRTNVSACE